VAEFLTTNGTSDRLERIIKEARKELVLVSPYLKISKNLIERLQDADKLHVDITLIYGKDELKPEEKEKLDALKNLSLHYYENLHAKCFYNENQLIITSMNIYEFSEKTNREMGVLVNREEDDSIYSKAVNEVRSILTHSKPIKRESKGGLAAMGKAFMGVVNDLVDDAAGTPKKGFCVRCGQSIDFDTRHPLCPECYGNWALYKRSKYPEKHWHRCGKNNKVSKGEPLCPACSKKQ
jgi:phosphatidylserine/phosphatidylglycerophosphate/cardiolipin synthase-like enzyme